MIRIVILFVERERRSDNVGSVMNIFVTSLAVIKVIEIDLTWKILFQCVEGVYFGTTHN